MEETKKDEALPKVEKDMSFQVRGWFQSFAFWPQNQTVKVVAEQTPMDEMYGPMVALAKIEVLDGGAVIFTDEIPWAMPVAEVTLLLQVYMLSQAPDYKKPKKWQKLMEQFCFSFENFEPPEKMWWSKEPLID